MENTSTSPRIFISYSWKNSDVADTIDDYFKSIGIMLERDNNDVRMTGCKLLYPWEDFS